MRALLIVDLQNDFLPGGTMGVPSGNEIIPRINHLQESFPLVVATKDWHPRNHVSFASNHGRQPGEVVEVSGLKQILWPNHCIQNTEGAQFSPELHTERIAQIFHKGVDPSIDSYSTFYDNAHARSTGLGDYLKQHQVDEIVIVGLTTDYCILYSVLDARKLGFEIIVPLETCRGIDLVPGDIDRALDEMQKVGAKIVTDYRTLDHRLSEKPPG